MPTTTYIYITGDSAADLWGLSGRTRLQRMIKVCQHAILIDDIDKLPQQSTALLLCANYLFDSRVLVALLGMQEDMALYVSSDGEIPVAVRIDCKQAASMLAGLSLDNNDQVTATLPRYAVADIPVEFQKNLKRKDPPYVLLIDKINCKELESELFAGSYKGVTDLVTKWLWPVPAFWATHFCVRRGLSPNFVTIWSLILAILAGAAFWCGYYGIGLIMGWLMTFLDTVDGKLARVTVTSSHLGDILDHGLDLIHPPLWYIAWGVGLATTLTPITDATLSLMIGLIFFGYIGGRLCEGAFNYWLASFDLFIWRQIDSFNRLITARRNPNLILLTIGYLCNRPDIGFFSVVAWHLISLVILAVRLYIAKRTKKLQGSLVSWLEDIDPSHSREILAVRIFIRTPMKVHGKTGKH